MTLPPPLYRTNNLAAAQAPPALDAECPCQGDCDWQLHGGEDVSDLGNAVEGCKGFVDGQLDRYGQAIRKHRGPETIGMDVGTVATYVVPVGGGPVRGAVTAAAEGATRVGASAVARLGGETLARTGTGALVREGSEAAVHRGAQSLAETGARRVLDPTSIKGWDRAEEVYRAIRVDASDISQISPNTGFTESQIGRIKDRLFHSIRLRDDGLRRFDADPDIVSAWSRMTTGDHVASDIDLLRHQLFESRFESILKTDYRSAHEATIRSGRTWQGE